MEKLMPERSDRELVVDAKAAIEACLCAEEFALLVRIVRNAASRYFFDNRKKFPGACSRRGARASFLESVGQALREGFFVPRAEEEFVEWIRKEIRKTFRGELKRHGVPDGQAIKIASEDLSALERITVDTEWLRQVRSGLWREMSFHALLQRVGNHAEAVFKKRYGDKMPSGVSPELFLERLRDEVGNRLCRHLPGYEYRNEGNHWKWVRTLIEWAWLDLYREDMIKTKSRDEEGKPILIPRRVAPPGSDSEGNEVSFEDFVTPLILDDDGTFKPGKGIDWASEGRKFDLDGPRIAQDAIRYLVENGVTERQIHIWHCKSHKEMKTGEIARDHRVDARTIQRWYSLDDEEKIGGLLRKFREERLGHDEKE